MRATAHPHQAERLATLRRYGILDTPRESEFDDVAELVSELCGAPIAVVNLIDEHRQWFKAEVGLGVRETPLETSICSHVILESDFVEIEDTLTDPRTADNELCLAPEGGLRYYAGALLKAENGLPIGTLCVLDTKPNKLTEVQKKTLSILARRVMRELDLRLALRTQADLRAEMDHRVKNSLQTISSNLNLQERRAQTSGDWHSALDAIRRQIDAVSALHRELYRSDSADKLAMCDFVETLARHLENSLPVEIDLELDVCPLDVPAELAMTIGVVINEFVANAIKHAFGDGHTGRVQIVIDHEAGQLNLRCENDMGGTLQDRDTDATGLGQRLISASVAKHGGNVIQGPIEGGYRLDAAIPFTVAE